MTVTLQLPGEDSTVHCAHFPMAIYDEPLSTERILAKGGRSQKPSAPMEWTMSTDPAKKDFND
jgi:hypothetical protein